MNPCCHRFRKTRRAGRFAGALVPGVLLALMPKCPLCFAAWAAALGIALPAAAAEPVRQALIACCLLALFVSLFLFVRSIIPNHDHHVRRYPAKPR